MSVPAPTDGESPSKTTLFCQNCGHDSTADGNWDEREQRTGDNHRRVLSCPICKTDVISQPILAAPA